MKVKITAERTISAVMILFAAVILYSCKGMSVTANYSIGPAALPIACAILLILFSVMAWITSVDATVVSLAAFKTPTAKRALLLIALSLAFAISVSLFGIWIPLLAFSILSFFLIEKHSILKSVIMGIVWVGFLYVVFVMLLKMNIPLFR